MFDQNSPNKSALDDGLQVASGSYEEEKYPALQIDNSLFPVNTEIGGLCLTNVDNIKDQINAAPNTKVENQTEIERRERARKRRFIYIWSLVVLLVIVGACIGGILGSRKHKATHEQYDCQLSVTECSANTMSCQVSNNGPIDGTKHKPTYAPKYRNQ